MSEWVSEARLRSRQSFQLFQSFLSRQKSVFAFISLLKNSQFFSARRTGPKPLKTRRVTLLQRFAQRCNDSSRADARQRSEGEAKASSLKAKDLGNGHAIAPPARKGPNFAPPGDCRVVVAPGGLDVSTTLTWPTRPYFIS